MAGEVKFVLNRKAFRDQVLRNGRLQELEYSACESAASGDRRIHVRRQTQSARAGVVMISDGNHEAYDGALTRALGRVRV